MTTFLEYVCEKLLGPPAKRCGQGVSYWNCPCHDDQTPSFHTLPYKPEFKHRWMCHGCGMRGDAADLMRELIPGEKWPERKARLEQWRQEWQREVGAPTPKYDFSFRGEGSNPADTPFHILDLDEVLRVLLALFQNEETSEAFALQILTQAKVCAHSDGYTLDALVDYWQAKEKAMQQAPWLRADDPDIVHMALGKMALNGKAPR
jgi:CHC2 zinc finger